MGEVSGEHEGVLIERAEMQRRGAPKDITRDRRRAGINVDGDVDRR